MASENPNVNLNVSPDVQVKIRILKVESRDMENKNIKKENPEPISNSETDDAGNFGTCFEPAIQIKVSGVKIENLNDWKAKKEESSSEHNLPETDDTKCSVDNITNILTEKVNIDIDNCKAIKETECDKKKIETEQKQTSDNCKMEAKQSECDTKECKIKQSQLANVPVSVSVVTENLAYKVSRLEISQPVSLVTAEKATVIVKQKTDSLNKLLQYSSSSEDEEESQSDNNLRDEDESQSGNNVRVQTDEKSDNADSDSDDDDSSSLSSIDGIDDFDNRSTSRSTKFKIKEAPKNATLKVYADDDIQNIPVPDLSNIDIDLQKEEFLVMGHIEAVIENIVTIASKPGIPAYDINTCIFIDEQKTKKPIGLIYDVLGSIHAPLYCIRFNTASDTACLFPGTDVYVAPKSKFTTYVKIGELMRDKGTDASWVGDVELPPEMAAQQSDDDCSPESAEPRQAIKRKHSSQERHKRFESGMNRINSLRTHRAQMVDAQGSTPRTSRYSNYYYQGPSWNESAGNMWAYPSSYNPAVPPPNVFQEQDGRMRTPTMWNRGERVVPIRRPRSLYDPNQGQYVDYPNSDANHPAGPSFHGH